MNQKNENIAKMDRASQTGPKRNLWKVLRWGALLGVIILVPGGIPLVLMSVGHRSFPKIPALSTFLPTSSFGATDSIPSHISK